MWAFIVAYFNNACNRRACRLQALPPAITRTDMPFLDCSDVLGTISNCECPHFEALDRTEKLHQKNFQAIGTLLDLDGTLSMNEGAVNLLAFDIRSIATNFLCIGDPQGTNIMLFESEG